MHAVNNISFVVCHFCFLVCECAILKTKITNRIVKVILHYLGQKIYHFVRRKGYLNI